MGASSKCPPWKRRYSRFMLAWAVLSHTWLLLSVIALYRAKDSTGFSVIAFVLLIVNGVIWFVYGCFVLEKRNWAIIISTITSLTLASIMLAGVVEFKPEGTGSVLRDALMV